MDKAQRVNDLTARAPLRDVVAFTSNDGKFRTGIYKAGPEHQECKSG